MFQDLKCFSDSNETYTCPIHSGSNRAFMSTIVNRALPSWYEKSLEITLTVPLNSQ